MTRPPGSDQGIEIRAIVDKIYEVALDPENYETLLDTWEAELAPLRTGPIGRAAADQLEAHVERASVFLNRYAASTPEPITRVLKQHIPFSAVALGQDLSVIASNFDLEPDRENRQANLSDVPFLTPDDVEEVLQLASTVFQEGEEIIHALSTESDASAISLVKIRPATSDPRTKAVVAIFSHIHWRDGIEDRLRRSFALSKTEVEIVRLMLEMKGRSEIARIRRRSPETIKRHASSIFRKTGCRSSTELLLLVMSFVNLVADAGSDHVPSPEGLRAVRVPRRNSSAAHTFHYLEAGAADGRPCIHLPGPYCLSQWPSAAERSARERGIRILTLIRTGYGPSAHRGSNGDLASDVASEILALMDQLGVESAPVLTQSNDLVFAFRLARKAPDRVNAIIGCAGALPLGRPEQFNHMDKWHRFVWANARFAPRLLPFIVKAGFFLAQKIGKRRFLEQVYANAPGDVAVLADPDCMAAIEEGSRFALSDGVSAHAAFAEQILYFARPDWSSDVRFAQGRIPSYLINGSKDPMFPSETLNEIARTYPRIRIKVYDNAGEFVFFQHWPEVLEVVSEHI